uniref:Uncharacterized protein n=1 Tax=Arundo donax TaxID=35708 RepID=A0A0A9GP35_ARUDO
MALRNKSALLGAHLDKVAKPNMELLRRLGLSACDFSSFFSGQLTVHPKRIQDTAVHVGEFSVP